MKSRVERLVYRSQRVAATKSGKELDSIFASAVRNNAREGISGALAALDDCFVQVLEGEHAKLDTLLRRLDADPRHEQVEVLDRRTIDKPLFVGWAMARVQPAAISPSALQILASTGAGAAVTALMFQYAAQTSSDLF